MTNRYRPLRRPCWAAVAGFLCFVFSASVAAQQPHSYNITHYDLRVEPDFARKTLRIAAAIEIANPAGEKSFSFALGNKYQVTAARAGGAEAQVQRGDGEITITTPRAAKRITLNPELGASPDKSGDEPRPVIDDNSLFLLWSDAFYPEDFDDWATLTTTVVLPQKFQAIAPGRLVATRQRGGRVEYVFRTLHPTVSFSVFADSRWVRTERELDGRRYVTLLHPDSQKYAEQIFATSPDVVKFFSELHGGYPFDEFAFVTIEGMYARRAFPGWVAYSPRYLEREMTSTGYDAHETSLLWWGLTAHGRGPGSWQWTEGLGDYVEFMYAEARHKPVASIFAQFRRDYLATPPEQDLLYAYLRGNTPQKLVHGKYPWLMQVMRERLGDEAFRRGIRLLFTRFRYRTFSMDEFIAEFEQASGQSLRWWREQWLQRKGVPVVAF